jgi:hypothetical protein
VNCTCLLGGKTCGVCRGREAQAKRFAELESMVLSLARRVVGLEETAIAQGRVLDAMAALNKGEGQK